FRHQGGGRAIRQISQQHGRKKMVPSKSLLAILSLILLLGGSALAQPRSIDARVLSEITPFKGKVFVYAKNLDTGKTFSYNGDERVKTASTIKIAVLLEAFA